MEALGMSVFRVWGSGYSACSDFGVGMKAAPIAG